MKVRLVIRKARRMACLLGAAGALALSGCTNFTKGMIRKSDTDGQGAMAAGCRNVSETARVDVWDTTYYHTSNTSAFREGMAAGLADTQTDTTDIFTATRRIILQPDVNGEKVFENMPSARKPYCRAFAFSQREVAEAVNWVLKRYPMPVKTASIEKGLFVTDLAERKSDLTGAKSDIASLGFLAKDNSWKEGLIITVTEERSNRTVLRVARRIYISRDENGYFQGQSSGYNEIALMTAVMDRLANKPGFKPLIQYGPMKAPKIGFLDVPEEPVAAPARSAAARAWSSPGQGSPERRAILSAIRPAFERRIGGAMMFLVKDLRVGPSHAFITVSPLRPDGKPIPDPVAGGRNAIGTALLARGRSGWTVIRQTFEAADKGYCSADRTAPRGLVPGCP